MTPAPLSRRFLAGLIDGFLLLFVCVVSFIGPLMLKGVVLPMWGVLAAIIGLNVVPLAFQRQTIGFRFMKLELVGADGHAVDLGNVLFRELIGRGLFPLAYVYTVLAGLIAKALGIMQFGMPTGLGALLFLACSLAVLIAIIGHFYALSTKEGRTFADLMARSFVVAAPARPLPTDAEELAELLKQRSSTSVKVALFQIFIVAGVIALPFILTMQVGENSQARIERIRREGIEKKFNANPSDRHLAAQLRDALERAGLHEDAEKVIKKFAEASQKRDAQREISLRDQLRKDPKDENAFSALIELLEEADRIDDAKAVYLTYLGADVAPDRREGFGNWLASHDRNDEAEAQFRQALTEDPLLSMGHTLLGLLLKRVNRNAEAQEELFLGLLDDPTDEDANDAMTEINSSMSPLSAAKKNELTARYASWSQDAGR